MDALREEIARAKEEHQASNAKMLRIRSESAAPGAGGMDDDVPEEVVQRHLADIRRMSRYGAGAGPAVAAHAQSGGGGGALRGAKPGEGYLAVETQAGGGGGGGQAVQPDQWTVAYFYLDQGSPGSVSTLTRYENHFKDVPLECMELHSRCRVDAAAALTKNNRAGCFTLSFGDAGEGKKAGGGGGGGGGGKGVAPLPTMCFSAESSALRSAWMDVLLVAIHSQDEGTPSPSSAHPVEPGSVLASASRRGGGAGAAATGAGGGAAAAAAAGEGAAGDRAGTEAGTEAEGEAGLEANAARVIAAASTDADQAALRDPSVLNQIESGDHVYRGETMEGVPHGRGRKTWTSGDTYDGEWCEGKRHGQGTNTWYVRWERVGWGRMG